jgi:hypothetical protein
MTHFLIIEYEQTTDPRVRAVYDEIKGELGFGMVPNIFKSMETTPGFWR